jgi:hypothetical protein
MERAEYVQWCKDRALRYLTKGDITEAVTSMMSDMDKRDDTKVSQVLVALGMLAIINRDEQEARRFIVGFH